MAKKISVPPRRTCGTMEVHQRLLESDPNFRLALGALEHDTQDRLTRPFALKSAGPVTIPVVVQVVYKTAAQKISVAQVNSQIDALNRDYSATNPDKSKTPAPWSGLVSDTLIRFALATKDPAGKTTTGIVYTKTTKNSFPQDDSVKFKSKGGADAWPRDNYLNLWVCNLGGGLLGYAQFPGGKPETDGVVILYSAFGTMGTATSPYNLGRSATHEVGHWLNLHHIWGDTVDCSGNDFVADTPNAQHPNFGKPTFPHISCNNGPNGDMFVNYMDYVDDDTMVMFTSGQVARMHTALDSARPKVGSGRKLGPGA
jgi:hypothetical protein